MPTGNTIVGLYGTLGVPDTLASNTATIYEIGEDNVWRNMQLLLAAHNMIMNDLLDDFVMPTTLQYMRYGGNPLMDMDEMDEHGTPDSQKVITGSFVGFPLRKFGRAIQWTRDYFTEMTGIEFNEQITAMLDADVSNVIRQVQRALFKPANYNFTDWLVRANTTFKLPVKALVNADGAPIPPGPNGEAFNAGTHTHYLGSTTPGTLVEADVLAGLNTVLEHFRTGKMTIYINAAQESTFRGFADFQKLYDSTLTVSQNVTYAKGSLDTILISDRLIGTYRGAEVWVKYWVPAGYVTFLMSGDAQKVLAWRTHPRKPSDFVLMGEHDHFPLRANWYGRYFGLGVYNRVGAAVLDSVHGSYTAPTIA